MSLYLEHFGLREAPFRITPHTDFFFDGANRGATLDALIYAITHDEGIVKVTGEVGSGKTMLCRMLLERLPAHVDSVYLANPSLSRDELLYALADELHMPDLPDRPHLLLRNLQQHLIDLYAQGRQVVVVIDEAHAMPTESLEEVRLLSNLESTRNKLLQIVLFGQPELDDILFDTPMRQLRERITHNFALEPLQHADVGQYIQFRLRAAGYQGPPLFAPAALRLIADVSGGLTRRINILADKALLAAFSENVFQVTAKHAKAAVADTRFLPMNAGRGDAHRRRLALTAGAGLLAAAAVAAGVWMARPPAPAAADSAAAPPRQATTPAVAQSTTPARPTPPPTASPPTAPPQTAPRPPAPTTTAPIASQRTDDRARGLPPLLAARTAAFDAWLPAAPDSHYFVQLLRTHATATADVEQYLQRLAHQLDPDQLRVYRLDAGKTAWMGVIYGDYPSRQAAQAAIAGLPEPLRAAGAYARPVSHLRPR